MIKFCNKILDGNHWLDSFLFFFHSSHTVLSPFSSTSSPSIGFTRKFTMNNLEIKSRKRNNTFSMSYSTVSSAFTVLLSSFQFCIYTWVCVCVCVTVYASNATHSTANKASPEIQYTCKLFECVWMCLNGVNVRLVRATSNHASLTHTRTHSLVTRAQVHNIER